MSRLFIVWLSLLAAMILAILPLPVGVIWLRPSWVLLVLIYWWLMFPDQVGVGYAFWVGLLLDLLQGTLLGIHTMALLVVAYIVLSLYNRIRRFPTHQQMLTVFSLIFLYQLVIYGLQGLVGQSPQNALYWLSVVISTLLWPLIFTVFNDWCARLQTE